MLTMPDEAGVSTSVSKILVPSAGSLVEGRTSEHSSAEECGLTARPVSRGPGWGLVVERLDAAVVRAALAVGWVRGGPVVA